MKARVFIILAIIFSLLGCHRASHRYQGYIENQGLYLASPFSGKLIALVVQRGQSVHRGDRLAVLDNNPQRSVLAQTRALLEESRHLYFDLRAPRRKLEQDAIEAQIHQVEAQIGLAKLRVDRYTTLYTRHVSDKDTLDAASERLSEVTALKSQFLANLALAKKGSRKQRILAQRAKMQAALANMMEMLWELKQKTLYAPTDGLVFDTYFKEGEFVPAQQAVLSLLAPEYTYIQFFVPVNDLPSFHIGQSIAFTCEGCTKEGKAVIRYISPMVEYAPPLVYSRDNNAKLVFRIKASPAEPEIYKPGQPVIVMEP